MGRLAHGPVPVSNPGEHELKSSTDSDEDSFNMRAVAYGVGFGIIVSSVVFAITQNPVWIGLGIPFGAALGIAFGEALQRTRQ